MYLRQLIKKHVVLSCACKLGYHAAASVNITSVQVHVCKYAYYDKGGNTGSYIN